MKRFSIQIPTLGEKSLGQVLDSIRLQDSLDYEVVVVDSSGKDLSGLRERWPEVRFTALPVGTGLLQARWTAFHQSGGEYSLLLDSTRVLTPGALSRIAKVVDSKDMWFLAEGSIGVGYWTRAAALDKEIAIRDYDRSHFRLAEQGFLLPRLFRSRLLSESFAQLRRDLPLDLLYRIYYGDHHLIWSSARRLSTEYGLVRHVTLAHIEDSSLIQVVRKYRRYGESRRELRDLGGFGQVGRVDSHWRSMKSARPFEVLMLAPLYGVRAAAFLLGSWAG